MAFSLTTPQFSEIWGDNDLDGTIPIELANAIGLASMYVFFFFFFFSASLLTTPFQHRGAFFNHLTGGIPSEMGFLSGLQVMYVFFYFFIFF